MRVRPVLIAFTTAAALAAASAVAQQPGQPAPGMGPGKGPGMMQGPGGGMGPGMMGGGGMMGEGMGPGMMGGGMGLGRGGMMGGGGMMMGPGGGIGALWQLDLTDAQRQQVLKIQDDLRRKNWDLLGKQQDEQAKLRDAYLASGKRDRAAIIAAYKRIGELRVQRIENSLDAAEKVEGALTQQQRDQLKRYGPWWMSGGEQ
ncbi:MAG TPA: Spy/CpxP family protein refolding chaperone [Burkholderiales bacterium]|nr:Spy/CpxP family protein refolding chaperone [Burkholderiales bacterium]